jgi:hypothetical protein
LAVLALHALRYTLLAAQIKNQVMPMPAIAPKRRIGMLGLTTKEHAPKSANGTASRE